MADERASLAEVAQSVLLPSVACWALELGQLEDVLLATLMKLLEDHTKVCYHWLLKDLNFRRVAVSGGCLIRTRLQKKWKNREVDDQCDSSKSTGLLMQPFLGNPVI